MATVNESGLYSILFYIQPTKARGLTEEEASDKCERVRKFKRWVTHEVLPSIRKHGGYMAGQEQMTPEEMALASMRWLESKVAEQRVQAMHENQCKSNTSTNDITGFGVVVDCAPTSNDKNMYLISDHFGVVYAVEYGDKVKVGCSSNVVLRMQQLRRQAESYGNVKMGRFFCTMPGTNYKSMEKQAHQMMADKRITGTELFDVDIDEAISVLNELEPIDESPVIEARAHEFCLFMQDVITHI